LGARIKHYIDYWQKTGSPGGRNEKHFAVLLFVALALGLCVPPVFAQASGSVKGVCKDAQGNPLLTQ